MITAMTVPTFDRRVYMLDIFTIKREYYYLQFANCVHSQILHANSKDEILIGEWNFFSYIMESTNHVLNNEMISALYQTNTLSWIFTMPSHWNNSFCFHSLMLRAQQRSSKYQVYKSLFGRERSSNLRYTALEVSTLTITRAYEKKNETKRNIQNNLMYYQKYIHLLTPKRNKLNHSINDKQ